MKTYADIVYPQRADSMIWNHKAGEGQRPMHGEQSLQNFLCVCFIDLHSLGKVAALGEVEELVPALIM